MNLIDLLNILDKFPNNKTKVYNLYGDDIYGDVQFLASTTDGEKHVFNDWLNTRVSSFEIIGEDGNLDISIFI